MSEEYVFEGRTVEKVYESYGGSYWVITDEEGQHPYGFACISGMEQFAEWGKINRNIFEREDVNEVPKENWVIAGPERIDIQKK